MAAVLPSQAPLTRFTVRHPQQLRTGIGQDKHIRKAGFLVLEKRGGSAEASISDVSFRQAITIAIPVGIFAGSGDGHHSHVMGEPAKPVGEIAHRRVADAIG
jgi:hypothetical protein